MHCKKDSGTSFLLIINYIINLVNLAGNLLMSDDNK